MRSLTEPSSLGLDGDVVLHVLVVGGFLALAFRLVASVGVHALVKRAPRFLDRLTRLVERLLLLRFIHRVVYSDILPCLERGAADSREDRDDGQRYQENAADHFITPGIFVRPELRSVATL